jgi:hypothetical protein
MSVDHGRLRRRYGWYDGGYSASDNPGLIIPRRYLPSNIRMTLCLTPSPLCGRGPGRGGLHARRPDCLHNTFNVREYVVIPESQDSVTLRMQPLSPFFVFLSFCRMMPTVSFNYYPSFRKLGTLPLFHILHGHRSIENGLRN